MSVGQVVLGEEYSHPSSDTTKWKLESASPPECDNTVMLVEVDAYCKCGFGSMWRGTWETFRKEWTRV